MIFGKEEEERFNRENKCWIFKGEFNDDKTIKVRDHCHFTGRYRGAAHNSCNFKYRKPDFTPIAFHNLAGYVSHLFIKNLVLAKVISIVFQTTRKSILALVKEYRLVVIRIEKLSLYIIK